MNEFEHSYNMARKLGFKNINIDLMFGLPGQSFEMWKETLDKVTKLNPEHLSCYSLILEEGTPFYSLYKEEDLPDEDTERTMYEYTKRFLAEKGYLQYEISNFSKKNFECKHNIVYWELNNYIGVGAAAHSFYDGVRYSNETDVKKYIEGISKKVTSIVKKHKNTLEDTMEEFMFLGLRKICGISINEFSNRFRKKYSFRLWGNNRKTC